jgi:hypothetical protein
MVAGETLDTVGAKEAANLLPSFQFSLDSALDDARVFGERGGPIRVNHVSKEDDAIGVEGFAKLGGEGYSTRVVVIAVEVGDEEHTLTSASPSPVRFSLV